ncbi:trehalase-like [Paramacrobiotus metropolitanus]|uniref:trehalase-like n=1 Tax=Paramacrobiotus metropolitanus TaxID=2943436 RepID=UPI002445AD16|nr:trehalase-like [Paramacrobiotus metropolitanus]
MRWVKNAVLFCVVIFIHSLVFFLVVAYSCLEILYTLYRRLSADPCPTPPSPQMDHPVFCRGPLLHAVEMSGIFTDSKSFVDRPLLVDPHIALEKFAALGTWPEINQVDLRNFVEECFGPPGSDLETVIPGDFREVAAGGLPVYHKITDERLRTFAEKLHHKWGELGRKVSAEVAKHPDRHTIIPLPYPFIVPGGRFREVYYWDSFWTIQGLLVSGMAETARGMLLNFAHLQQRFGLIPNGNRIYYTKRSEPPLFALMVQHYCDHEAVKSEDVASLIPLVLPALLQEYEFWMRERSVELSVAGGTFTMNRYTGGDCKVPRPESYWEDFHDGETLQKMQLQSAESFYGNIAAAAESGLDFSTRWLENAGEDFLTMRTETIIPVDLNAFLYAHERVLSELYMRLGDSENSEKYMRIALRRGDGIHAVFWSDEHQMWRDYDLKLGRQREAFYLSNLVPLFARCDGETISITNAAFMQNVLQSADMVKVTSFPGGHPVSLNESSGRHCQWDFPNAWPPLQLMMIEAFNENPELEQVALEWAQKWISVVHIGYLNSSHIYEKYDARTVGRYGSGGEYLVQEGFGWTNGGILRLLELFPTKLQAPHDLLDPDTPSNTTTS